MIMVLRQTLERHAVNDTEGDAMHCDIAVIGGGPGGYVAAIKAAQLGAECILVEKGHVGGTCLNRGCIPTKTYLHAAELYAEMSRAAELGISVEGAHVDYPAMRSRVAQVVEELRGGIETLLAANGITLLRGIGRVEAPGKVSVVLNEPDEDGRTEVSIEAESIIVAAGSTPAAPPIEGTDLPGVHTSDTILEELPEARRIVIVGGGVIGMEFAGIYADLGSEVTVLEFAPRILATMDREFGQSLGMSLKKRGGSIVTNACVKSIAQTDGGLSVAYETKGEEAFVEADAVLIATGRRTDVESAFAPDCLPDSERGRITVDGACRTSVPGVFAIGDIADAGPQLAHAASAQGIVAAMAARGLESTLRLDLIPSCVYTSPEIASVGMTEREAKDAGIAAKTGKFAMSGNGKTVIAGLDRSFMKVVADEDGRLLGAQFMCGRATDMVGEMALAIAQGMTAEEAANVVRAHPTFEEGIGEALESLLGGAIHAMPARRKR